MVIDARDVVWLRPVIQTHDILYGRDVEVPFQMNCSHQGLPQALTFTRYLGSSKARVIQPTARRVTPDGIGPPENANRHTTCRGLALSMLRSGCAMEAMPVQMALT